MIQKTCPRCGCAVPEWQPVHLRCALHRILRYWRYLVGATILLLCLCYLYASLSPLTGDLTPEATRTSAPMLMPASTSTAAPLATPTSLALTATDFIEPIRKQIFSDLVDALNRGIGGEEAYNEIAQGWGMSVDAVKVIEAEGIGKDWRPPTPSASAEISFIEPIRKQIYRELMETHGESGYDEVTGRWGASVDSIKAIVFEGTEKGWGLPTATPIPPTPTPTPPMPTPVPPTPIPTTPPTASIAFPQNGDAVGESVIVRGVISGLGSGQRAFLCVKSQAFGRLIYPQGEILPDLSGQWAVESIYHSIGYSYETFVVTTNNPDAAMMLADKHYRAYGMRSLPQDTIIISSVAVVTRE